MKELAIERLVSFGFLERTLDLALLEQCIAKAGRQIRNYCNIPEVPAGLFFAGADMAVAEYLSVKQGMGSLEGFVFDAAVKQISEGDVNITYAFGSGSKTPEQRFSEFVSALGQKAEKELAAYRRVPW